MIEHIEEHKNLYRQTPETITADAGYGSQENYQYAEDNNIEAFIKYNYFHKENTKKWQRDIRKSDNLYYNAELDCYFCPMGQAMMNVGEYQTKTKTGFPQTISKYRALNCIGCPLRGACHKSRNNRTIEVIKPQNISEKKPK